jgi:hypothetical protein
MSDPDEAGRRPVVRFGPDRRLIALSAVLALVALGAVIVSADPAGRFLAAVAALVLAAYAITDVVFWPRLTASGEGLRVRSPATRAQLAWTDIEGIRVDERNRLGLMARTLEIDAGPLLLVFSRRALGEDPRTVLGLLQAFDPHAA